MIASQLSSRPVHVRHTAAPRAMRRGPLRLARGLAVRAAGEDDVELPKPNFQVRRLTPLPSDYGAGEDEPARKKPAKKAEAEAGDASSSSAAPTASPFAATAAAKPAASPFAKQPASPFAKPASPFASPPSPLANPVAGASKPAASPFAAGAKPPAKVSSPFQSGAAKSPFGGSALPGSGPASPFQVRAADIANVMAPLDVKVADGKPWWQKLPLPAANQLWLVFTFGSIIALMLVTAYVTVELGAVRLND